MTKIFLAAACAAMLVAVGCDKKDQDAALAQGRSAVDKATAFAGSAWKSAVDEANKLTDGSATPALESAQKQLEAARDKMSHIKAPTNLDDLKLDSVKEEIDRIQAALTIQKIKAAMDERVKTATEMKDNAEKKVDDVRSQLQQADSEYEDLQNKLNGAQKAYNDASEKVQATSKKVQNATGI